jgi:transglutaminase-like putative cysteine protease
MRIRIVHETAYRYAPAAKSLIQVLRMTPRDHDGQHVLHWRIDLDVDGSLRAGEDALGNIIHILSVDGPVERLTLRVAGEVETHDANGVVTGTVERFPGEVFLRETPLTAAPEQLRHFAREAAKGTHGDALKAAHRLLSSVHDKMSFDPDPAKPARSAEAAFDAKRGTAADLSHVFIAAARHLAIPARCVTGYFVRDDGKDRQEASHAWAEAHIPRLGWVGFDPVNCISPTEGHVRVAVGLDHLGAAPVRASRYGGGEEKLDVALNVAKAMRQTQS